MAKSKAQTLTLFQECVDLYDTIQTFLSGSFETKLNELSTAIEAGDDEPEDSEMAAGVDNIRSAGETLWSAVEAATSLAHKVLGRYAGSKDLESLEANLAAFNDQLWTDTENLESRGLTLFSSMTPDGGNAGNGTVVVLTTDPEGQQADIAHPGALRLRCISDALSAGGFEGAETFVIDGGTPADNSWDDGAIGNNGGGYEYAYGDGTREWGSGVDKENSGSVLQVMSGNGNSVDNQITNSNFETGFTGTGADVDKIPDWTITANAATITEETTDPINGDSSLNFGTGAAGIMEQAITQVESRAPYVFGCKIETEDPNADLTGNLIIRIKDDSTTHSTLTIDAGALTDDVPVVQAQGFVMPDGIGANLRIEIEGGAWGGTGTRFVLVDDVFFGPMDQVDGGYALAVCGGPAPFRYNDEFTATTSDAGTGTLQRFSNRQWQRYFRHSGVATYWTDP